MNVPASPEGDEYELCNGMAGRLAMSMFEVFPRRFGTPDGKFVVIDDAMYVGPAFYPTPDGRKELYHGTIVESYMLHAGREEELETLLRANLSAAALQARLGVHDSGLVTLAPGSLNISGESGSFLQVADESARLRTAHLAQQILGPLIRIHVA